MCGRTCCALRKDHLLRACEYRSKAGTYECPEWKDVDPSGQYQPSYNVPPRSYSGVLIHSSQLASECPSGESSAAVTTERVATAMLWTLVPAWWNQPSGREMAVSTFNCRIESCLTRPFFRSAIEDGRRCIALAEGYYEWKDVPKSGKQPYFVYNQQPEGVSLVERALEDCDVEQLYHEGRWNGLRLLTMAAIFDVTKNGTFGFSILTMEAPQYMRWLHHRVPVILDGEEAVSSWLDPGRSSREVISTSTAEFPTNLQWHAVSSTVGKVSNKGIECVLPVPEMKKRKSTLLDKWLNLGSQNPATGEGPSHVKRSRSRSPQQEVERKAGPGPF
ncbi:abasic site processing protein HMCES-like isoform X2 [Amblyomma americanum]